MNAELHRAICTAEYHTKTARRMIGVIREHRQTGIRTSFNWENDTDPEVYLVELRFHLRWRRRWLRHVRSLQAHNLSLAV